MNLLATVECQLVLRCLDIRSRLRMARCNEQLYAAASQPFAWPQEQMVTLEVANESTAFQSLGARVRRSLLRLSVIHLRVQVPSGCVNALCSEVITVPNVQFITVVAPNHAVASGFLLPLLRHPSAPQLRVLDISCLWHQRCSPAELQQLQVLPHLHSLSLGDTACRDLLTLAPLSQLPSLTHLSLHLNPVHEQHLYSSLSFCVRLLSLHLGSATVCADLAHCLSQMPRLQRLHLRHGDVANRTGHAWTTVRSLREIKLDYVSESNRLLPVLSSLPSLRLLRWRCHAPQFIPQSYCHNPVVLPQMESLGQLLTAVPLLQVELLMPRTFEEWPDRLVDPLFVELVDYQRRVWDELHQLPVQLPRVRIVDV
jgi:hypothetical protein